MKKKRNTKSVSRKIIDFVITTVCLVGIGFAGYGFYKELNVSLADSSNKEIGSIYFKKKTAMRRLKHKTMWERLQTNSPIYDGDYIQTGELSEASIIFTKDGSQINILENTMFQIVEGEKNTLKFSCGTINVVSGDKSKGISIQTGDKVFDLEDNTSAVISVPKTESVVKEEKQTAIVAVSSGSVKVKETPKTESKIFKNTKKDEVKIEQTISAGDVGTVETTIKPIEVEKKSSQNNILPVVKKEPQKATEKKAKKEVEKKKADFVMLMPTVTYSITQDSDNLEAIPFYWTNIEKVRIEFSFNSDYRKIIDAKVLSSKSKKASIKIAWAKPNQIIYWRAIPYNQKISENVIYPTGKILVNSVEEKDVSKIVEEIYDSKKAEEIKKKVDLTTKNISKNLTKVNNEVEKKAIVADEFTKDQINESIEEIKTEKETVSIDIVEQIVEKNQINQTNQKNQTIAKENSENEDSIKRILKMKAERQAKIDAENKAKEEAERKAKLEAERKAKEEAERKAKLEAERKAKEEAERKAKLEAERKAKEEAERKAKLEAERKAKEEAERQAKLEAERKAKEEAERQAKLEAERKAQEEAERQAKLEAERKAKEEAERQAKLEAERKAKEEAERQAKLEAERKAQEEAERQAKLEAERKAKEEAERQAKLEAERKAKEEADRQAKLEAERKAKEEAEHQAKIEEERKAKEEAERQAKLEAENEILKESQKPLETENSVLSEFRDKFEADKRAKEEAENEILKESQKPLESENSVLSEFRDKFEADKRAKEETKLKEENQTLKEEALSEQKAEDKEVNPIKERKAKIIAEKKAKEEAELQAKLEEERKIREEEELKAKLEAEKKAKEEAERQAKLEAERKAKEEAERKAKEEAEKKAKQEAEIQARFEAQPELNDIVNKFEESKPELSLPRDNITYTEKEFDTTSPSITFAWKPVKNAADYRIEIKDSQGKLVFAKNVKDTKYVLSDKIYTVAENGEYEWSVKARRKVSGKTVSTQIATRKFKVEIETVEATKIDLSNLVTD